MISKKLFVIALDGADYELIKQWLPKLPNLKKLVDRGIFAPLESTTPNISPTAWASFMTGLPPEKHRILDFTSRESGSFGEPVNFSVVHGETLWRRLSVAGKKVVVFNVPMTYPPEKVYGVLIGGFPVPKEAKDYCYPKEVAEDLHLHGWDFSDVPMQSFSKSALDLFLADLRRRVKDRVEATIYLMEKYPWDFFMVHFMETDKIQHEFLNFTRTDLAERRYYNKYKNAAPDFFVFLDRELGRILDRLPKEADLLVVSDHGFRPCRQSFYTNTWLLLNGYMRLKGTLLCRFKYLLFRSFLSPMHLFSLLPDAVRRVVRRRVDQKYYLSKKEPTLAVKLLRLAKDFAFKYLLIAQGDVDWQESEAYAIGNACLVEIVINRRKVIDVESLAEEIRTKLSTIVDKKIRGPILDRVLLASELYEGVGEGLADVVAFDSRAETLPLNHNLFLSNRILSKNIWFPDRAAHGMEGIFIVVGDHLGKIKKSGLKIQNCARIILDYFGLASGPSKKEVARQKFGWLAKDKEQVKESLKSMGYL